jgi:AraC-like DNA-binding protein
VQDDVKDNLLVKLNDMPIFMDRHDVSGSVTAEIVAQIHLEDLKIQQKYNCRGLTYWYDDARKMAFCLIEAPDRNAIVQMHDHAHGNVPHQIIEVDKTIVESFLGRIEDPKKAQNTDLNIINEPAFRTIMMVSIENHSYKNSEPYYIDSHVKHIYKHINGILKSYNGTVARQNEDGSLISFYSVTEAVRCALKIHEDYRVLRTKYQIKYSELFIGLHAGIPVTDKKSIFEDTIKLAQRMCIISAAEIVISTEIQQLFESENYGEVLNDKHVLELSKVEEKFLNNLMDLIEKEWHNTQLKVEDFEQKIGVSKSKLYREMIRLTGKSPSVFLLHFRLRKSLHMLQMQKGNVSEIAFYSGFNSASYFAKCFRKKYGISPSELVQ